MHLSSSVAATVLSPGLTLPQRSQVRLYHQALQHIFFFRPTHRKARR